ncbi:MAG: response regulator RpfG family c-di-GMP phosphodiesterase [Planctomycetota bacterium]|jgi:response regulator RpfG family c-di-GMP phosphodiesterase
MNNRVLLVDDSVDVIEGLARLMQKDFAVTTANSSTEALRAIREEGPFAVVVSDQQMPGGDGLDLLSRIREDWPSTIRILMTAHADLQTVISATNEGEVFRFLQKPLPHETLRDAIDDALSRHELAEVTGALTGELQSSRASVGRLATVLEGGFSERVTLVHEMSDLARQLSTASSIHEIAEFASQSANHVFPSRSIRLALAWNGFGEAGVCIGPKLEGKVYRVSIVTNDGEIGYLFVSTLDSAGEPLTADDHELLNAIASFTGVAAHNQIRRRERDQAQHSVVFAMARLAETRDNETGKHIERVSSFCALAADGLIGQPGFEEVHSTFIADLIHSAPLHDIGKVGIPDAILLKPGKLDADEWAIMQKHAVLGADILRQVIAETSSPGYLNMALDIAWCHHEKWDGSGYPRGLKGQEIPVAARILAVADVFDALTTVRPYKQAWSMERAVDYLREMSGTQFDPDVVDSFLARKDEANEIRVRLSDEPE